MCVHLSWCHKRLRRNSLGHDRSFFHLSCRIQYKDAIISDTVYSIARTEETGSDVNP